MSEERGEGRVANGVSSDEYRGTREKRVKGFPLDIRSSTLHHFQVSGVEFQVVR
jgi:hypothetical protein